MHRKHKCERIFSIISGLRVRRNSMYQSRTGRLNWGAEHWVKRWITSSIMGTFLVKRILNYRTVLFI